MKRIWFTEEQIIGVLKEHQAGLNEHLFTSLRHARHLIAAWRDDYNHHRPHMSLDGLTPREFLNQSTKD